MKGSKRRYELEQSMEDKGILPGTLKADEQYFDLFLGNKRALLTNIVHYVRKQAGAMGLDPELFRINRLSFAGFAGMLEEDGEEYEGPFFQMVDDDQIICLDTRYIVEDMEIEVTVDAYRITGYTDGNRTWMWYEPDEQPVWQPGPGEDFFDLEEILRNEDTAWIQEVLSGDVD